MIPKDIEQRCADATFNRPLARRVDHHEHTEIHLPRLPGGGRRSQRGSGEDFYLTCDIFGNRGVFDRSSCCFFNGVVNLIKRISGAHRNIKIYHRAGPLLGVVGDNPG